MTFHCTCNWTLHGNFVFWKTFFPQFGIFVFLLTRKCFKDFLALFHWFWPLWVVFWLGDLQYQPLNLSCTACSNLADMHAPLAITWYSLIRTVTWKLNYSETSTLRRLSQNSKEWTQLVFCFLTVCFCWQTVCCQTANNLISKLFFIFSKKSPV